MYTVRQSSHEIKGDRKMKASKLVKQLNALIEIYGDTDIEVNSYGNDNNRPSDVRAWGENMEYANPENPAVVFQIS